MKAVDEQMPCVGIFWYAQRINDEHWDLGHGWSGDMPKFFEKRN